MYSISHFFPIMQVVQPLPSFRSSPKTTESNHLAVQAACTLGISDTPPSCSVSAVQIPGSPSAVRIPGSPPSISAEQIPDSSPSVQISHSPLLGQVTHDYEGSIAGTPDSAASMAEMPAEGMPGTPESAVSMPNPEAEGAQLADSAASMAEMPNSEAEGMPGTPESAVSMPNPEAEGAQLAGTTDSAASMAEMPNSEAEGMPGTPESAVSMPNSEAEGAQLAGTPKSAASMVEIVDSEAEGTPKLAGTPESAVNMPNSEAEGTAGTPESAASMVNLEADSAASTPDLAASMVSSTASMARMPGPEPDLEDSLDSETSQPSATASQLLRKRLCAEAPLEKLGSKRRRTIQLSPRKPPTVHVNQSINRANDTDRKASLELKQFLETDNEVACQTKLEKEVIAYCIQKLALSNLDEAKVLKPLREFLIPTPAQLADHDPSILYYMDLIDENADSEETMSMVCEMVLEQAASASQEWVVLVGDGKTYEHLQRVKRLYGSAFDKLYIFPGDWHILKNFQPVLMKAYYDVGLREFAKQSGYRAETLKSLENCSHFKRTHSFLTQIWEALLTEMVSSFATAKPEFADLLKSAQDQVTEATTNNTSTTALLMNIQCLMAETSAMQSFKDFVQQKAETDDTWRFWSNFVLKDCFSYISLFLAIRTSSWDLRMLALKSMSCLFSAYDRPSYSKILPNHLADIQSYPTDLLGCLRAGGFTVKFSGGIGHAVALDEAHEMGINKDMKMAVKRPTQTYIKKMTHFFSYRIRAQQQMQSQLFPTPPKPTPQDPATLDNRATTNKWDENVKRLRSLIRDHKTFPPLGEETNRGLINVLTGTKATPEQTHDLLNARAIGLQSYKNYVTHNLLQVPSVQSSLRQKRLLTMAPPKMTKRRLSQKEKEERDTNKFLRKRLAWCNQTGQKYDESEEQYTILPRALADADGNPHSHQKSNWTEKLEKRYTIPETTPFLSSLPWVPQVVIIDGMFAININPLRKHKTIAEYAQFIFKQFAEPRFEQGTQEVHFLFDHPNRLPFNPKFWEHRKRYAKANTNHTHIAALTPQSKIPRPWREHLNCGQCKRSIIEALGYAYLRSNYLQQDQRFIIAGCFTGDNQDHAWTMTSGAIPDTTTQFDSNAMESDMRIWRHALQSNHQRILIYSPDTDVYNIGLPLADITQQYIVQINPRDDAPRYVHLHRLLSAFRHDPDLASIPKNNVGSIMLQLYATTGCDYLSYVSGVGKGTFISYFCQHADFISSAEFDGCLTQTKPTDMKLGFLSFVRLIGTAYFKKNLATMVSKLGFETPNQLFNSIDLTDVDEKHQEWYRSIKRVIHVLKEEHRPPTYTALWRHWMRSCWVKEMWMNSTSENQYEGLAPPETQGWIKSDQGEYSIDWEDQAVQQKIQKTLNFLCKGCSCKTGCKTNRCSCQKNGRNCGASCECRGCTNLHLCTPVAQEEEEEEAERDEDKRKVGRTWGVILMMMMMMMMMMMITWSLK